MTERLDLELLDTKEYKALAKEIGEKEAKALISKSDDDLKAVISAHTVSMAQTTFLTKQTPAYQAAVSVKKDFDKGLRDQLKPLKLAVAIAAKTLNSRRD